MYADTVIKTIYHAYDR